MSKIPQKLFVVSVGIVALTVLAALGKATVEVASAIVSIVVAFCGANLYLTKTMDSGTPAE